MGSAKTPIITIEEHWLSQSVRDFYARQGKPDPSDEAGPVGKFTASLMEFGPRRLQAMDESGISVQVVSHAPNSIALDVSTCVTVNNELDGLIKWRPDRFGGFATLPMAEPEAAAGELRRCVRELGFVGTLIDSNCGGKYYDDPSCWPVFAAAEELDVPVYLHPAPNEHTRAVLYDGPYPEHVAETLSQYVWGWHSETAAHFLRLFAAGLFDRHPRLRLVMGHLGEMLPFQLDRIEAITSRWPQLGLTLSRPLRQVWDENVWITTSSMFFMAPMATALRQCKPERIIFSVDYPFGNNQVGTQFLHALRSEGLVDSDDVFAGIAYRNAQRLLKLKV